MMTINCDICGEPCRDGQGLYGGRGDGGRSGPQYATGRHYDCHTGKYGKPAQWSAPAPPPHKPIKTPNVTKGAINYSDNAARTFTVLDRRREMGRSRVLIECPFCFAQFWAYIWSISGGGKKCTNCGAMHASFGNAYPVSGNEDM